MMETLSLLMSGMDDKWPIEVSVWILLKNSMELISIEGIPIFLMESF